MPKVTATPYKGIEQPLLDCTFSEEITDDLPPDTIGECVVTATHKAWRNGFDPAHSEFFVVIKFS